MDIQKVESILLIVANRPEDTLLIYDPDSHAFRVAEWLRIPGESAISSSPVSTHSEALEKVRNETENHYMKALDEARAKVAVIAHDRELIMADRDSIGFQLNAANGKIAKLSAELRTLIIDRIHEASPERIKAVKIDGKAQGTGMAWKRCRDCDQPMLPKGRKKKPGEFDHARGCPSDKKRKP